MFQRRETGSVVLPAPRERVFQILREQVDPAARTEAEGVERLVVEHRGARSTFVLRDAPNGHTRLVHARATRPGLAGLLTPEGRLREAVEADLFRVRCLVDAERR